MSTTVGLRRLSAAVVFSSRFGSTEKIAKSFEVGLKEAGLETLCVNAQDFAPESLKQYDLICIGGPTEMFSASKQTKEYLKMTKGINLAGKFGFAFDTRLDSRVSGSASKYIEHAMDDQGLHVVAPRQSAMVDTVKERGAIVGAVLKEGEEKRFQELGHRIGELASKAVGKVAFAD